MYEASAEIYKKKFLIHEEDAGDMTSDDILKYVDENIKNEINFSIGDRVEFIDKNGDPHVGRIYEFANDYKSGGVWYAIIAGHDKKRHMRFLDYIKKV